MKTPQITYALGPTGPGSALRVSRPGGWGCASPAGSDPANCLQGSWVSCLVAGSSLEEVWWEMSGRDEGRNQVFLLPLEASLASALYLYHLTNKPTLVATSFKVTLVPGCGYHRFLSSLTVCMWSQLPAVDSLRAASQCPVCLLSSFFIEWFLLSWVDPAWKKKVRTEPRKLVRGG